MKSIKLILLLVLLLAACAPAAPAAAPTLAATALPSETPTPAPSATPAASPTPKATSPVEAGWKLVWSDEFEGPAGTLPDPKKWTYDTGGRGWGNAEHQYYTKEAENAALDGSGALAITARKTDPATNTLMCWYGECQYSSARLLTKKLFEVDYGRVEARLKLPFGQGIWPAFWMLGNDIDTIAWPTCGEIDIMENIGKESNIVHGTVHGPGYSGANGVGSPFVLTSGTYADDYHVFAVEWEKAEIRWFMDGSQFFKITPDQLPDRWVYDHPFFMILNLAVGGGWPGYPDATTTFPQTLLVDYVRVYQR